MCTLRLSFGQSQSHGELHIYQDKKHGRKSSDTLLQNKTKAVMTFTLQLIVLRSKANLTQ